MHLKQNGVIYSPKCMFFADYSLLVMFDTYLAIVELGPLTKKFESEKAKVRYSFQDRDVAIKIWQKDFFNGCTQ